MIWHDVSIDCVENMLKELNKLAYNCINKMKHNEYMIMNAQDMSNARCQISCHICSKCFQEGDVKCRDHDHRRGQFRGMAHQKYNINYYNNFYLPIVFHNLHDFITSMDKTPKIHVIPNSYEKFMSFSIGNLKFCLLYTSPSPRD